MESFSATIHLSEDLLRRAILTKIPNAIISLDNLITFPVILSTVKKALYSSALGFDENIWRGERNIQSPIGDVLQHSRVHGTTHISSFLPLVVIQ